jgi:hypothetical protein
MTGEPEWRVGMYDMTWIEGGPEQQVGIDGRWAWVVVGMLAGGLDGQVDLDGRWARMAQEALFDRRA